MKRLELTPVEIRTLRDMGIFHSHPRTRMRAQAIVRLSQGLTLQQVANEFASQSSIRSHYWSSLNPSRLVVTVRPYSLQSMHLTCKMTRYGFKNSIDGRPKCHEGAC